MLLEWIRFTALFLAFALLLAIMLADIGFRIIPNAGCGALVVLALVVHLVDGGTLGALLASLSVFLLAVVCWMRRWIGGGDVKLLAASVLLVAPGDVLNLLADTALAGGLLSVCYLLLSWALRVPRGRRPDHYLLRVLRAERWRIHHRRSIPYACAIGSGVMFTLLQR